MIKHEEFVDCLRRRKRAKVVFVSQKDGGELRERICAPMDYGPDRRAADKVNKYQFFDLDAGHPFMKLPDEIERFEVLDQDFDPADFVTWSLQLHPWSLDREWGRYS